MFVEGKTSIDQVAIAEDVSQGNEEYKKCGWSGHFWPYWRMWRKKMTVLEIRGLRIRGPRRLNKNHKVSCVEGQ